MANYVDNEVHVVGPATVFYAAMRRSGLFSENQAIDEQLICDALADEGFCLGMLLEEGDMRQQWMKYNVAAWDEWEYANISYMENDEGDALLTFNGASKWHSMFPMWETFVNAIPEKNQLFAEVEAHCNDGDVWEEDHIWMGTEWVDLIPSEQAIAEATCLCRVDAALLRERLMHVKMAISRGDDRRPALETLCVEVSKEEGLTLAATDAHLISSANLNVTTDADATLLIHYRYVDYLIQSLQDASGEVELLMSETKQLLVNADSFSLRCPSQDVKFPNYRSFFRVKGPVSIRCKKSDLVDLIEDDAMEESGAICFEIGDILVCSSDDGQQKEVAAEIVNPGELQIWLRYDHLCNLIINWPCEEMMLHFTDSRSLIQCVSEDGSVRSAMMPSI